MIIKLVYQDLFNVFFVLDSRLIEPLSFFLDLCVEGLLNKFFDRFLELLSTPV